MAVSRANGRKNSAAAVLLGFLLLVSMLSFVFVLYSTEIQPAHMESAEISTSQQTLTEMQSFHWAVTQAIETGRLQPFSLIQSNPQIDHLDASNIRQTFEPTENETITIDRYDRICSSDDGSSDNPHLGIGEPKCTSEKKEFNFNTETFVLNSDYRYYTNATSYGYEHQMIYSAPQMANEGSQSVVYRSGPTSPIQGKEITFYVFHESETISGGATVQGVVETKADKPIEFTLTNGTDDGTNDPQVLSLIIPTEMPLSEWKDILKDERASQGGHVINITYIEAATPKPTIGNVSESTTNYVRIYLEQSVEYEFNIWVLKVSR